MIFTIGHSNHTWDDFSRLLRQHGVETLVDVRSKPVSRFADFANRPKLARMLEREGLHYVFKGDSLEGKPSDLSCYDDSGKPDYDEIRSRDFFRAGIAELVDLAEKTTVALMCAEEDPGKCHRRLLIGPTLAEMGVPMSHIRGDGSVQGTEDLGNRRAYLRNFQAAMSMDGDAR